MSSSDVIAIVAIGATVLVSLLSGIVTMYVARVSNRAKRSEIAFAERLKAFQEVYEAISKVNSRINLFVNVFKNQDPKPYTNYAKILANSSESQLNKARAEVVRRLATIDYGFMEVYNKNRVYMPPHIDNEVQKYYKDVLESVRLRTVEEIVESVVQMKSLQENYSERILAMMHRFIGFE